MFWGDTPGLPQNGAPKNPFFERLKLGCQLFLISVDIQQTNILILFRSATLPGTPPNGPPENQCFERLNLECQCFMISAGI